MNKRYTIFEYTIFVAVGAAAAFVCWVLIG